VSYFMVIAGEWEVFGFWERELKDKDDSLWGRGWLVLGFDCLGWVNRVRLSGYW